MLSSASKIKCPKCERQIPKRIIMVTKGLCNNCGYRIAGALTSFAPMPKPSFSLDGPKVTA